MLKITIKTIDNLLNYIKDIKEMYGSTFGSDIGSEIWYRGQKDSSKELIPRIYRNDIQAELHKSETDITNDFYHRARQIIKNPPAKGDYSAWLTMMQHYGLPTRLLDWSKSPLIAAFFATQKPNETRENVNADPCVWALFPKKLNEQEGFEPFVYSDDSSTIQEMSKRAFRETVKNKHKRDNRIIACCSTGGDMRMYSQQAAFTLHNSPGKWEDNYTDDTLFKMIIPREECANFLYYLDLLGINQGSIFPDMEHIASDITSRYRKS